MFYTINMSSMKGTQIPVFFRWKEHDDKSISGCIFWAKTKPGLYKPKRMENIASGSFIRTSPIVYSFGFVVTDENGQKYTLCPVKY